MVVMDMLTDRQKLILKAIVEEYVATAIPVSSSSLTKKPYLGFSSALIRLEMATLEELGYLEKTHTSSGRVPSEKGYKYYVDYLVTRDESVTEDFPLIDEIFRKREIEKEQAIKEAINLLSELTNYTSLVVGSSEKMLVKKIDCIPLSERDAVILIVTSDGHIQNQTITIPDGMSINDLKEVVSSLNELLVDVPINRVESILNNKCAEIEIKNFMEFHEKLIDTFIEAFQRLANDNFYYSGMTNVLEQPEFNDINKARHFIRALEDDSLLKLVDNTENGLRVQIGIENEIISMDDCTIISVPYQISDDEVGKVAVIGPTRMQYKKVIPLVEYIAKNMSKLYKKK